MLHLIFSRSFPPRHNHTIRLCLFFLLSLSIGMGCTRSIPPDEVLDPASTLAPAAPAPIVSKPLDAGLQTGAVLLGEPQGRAAMTDHGGMVSGEPGAMGHAPGAGDQMAGENQKASQSGSWQYTCPMHPEIVQDHPGRCPKCGMELVPRKAEKDGKGTGR